MTWVKICGITNLEDALVAVDAGADAVGFVFYEKSARYVDAEIAGEIAKHLPPRIEKIGVLVGNYGGNLADLVRQAGLTGMQTHIRPGLESGPQGKAYGPGCFPDGFAYCISLPAEWFIEAQDSVRSFLTQMKAVTEARRSQFGIGQMPPLSTVFLDSGNLQQPGGTGRAFDWQKALPVVEYMRPDFRTVVAGGLTPSNVGEAIGVLKPWGVDVSSGVEAKPGKKDPVKVRAFIAAVRASEKKV